MKIFYNILSNLLFFCLSFLAHGQITTFQQIYQNTVDQSGRDALQTSDGGYIIIAMTESSPGDSDIYILKTDAFGDTVWTKTYGGSQPEYPYAIIETTSGNFLIVGYTKSFGSGSNDTYLIKINSSGNILWSQTYGGGSDDAGKEIIPTSDGNYIICGRSDSYSSSYDAFLMKINPAGSVIWAKYYGGSQYETARSVKQCADGGYIFTGQTMSYGMGNGDIYLVRTNAVGDTLWTKTFGGAVIDDGNGVVINSDGTFTVVAETNSFGAGDMDVQVFKTDVNGNLTWNKFYGGNQKDVSKSIQKTFDGGYIIGAISRSFGWINPDMWLLKLDVSGDTTWTRHYGSWDHEHCYSARQTADGGYIAIGHTKSYGPTCKIMFIKLDLLGTTTSTGELAASDFLNIYPNPSNGEFKINGLMPGAELKIYDSVGKEIYYNDSGLENLNLSGYPQGIYMLAVQSTRNLITRKIILR